MIVNTACLAGRVLTGHVCSTIGDHAAGNRRSLRATSKAFQQALPPTRLKASGPSDIEAMAGFIADPKQQLRMVHVEHIHMTGANTQHCVLAISEALQQAESSGGLHAGLRVDMSARILSIEILDNDQLLKFGQALAKIATVAKGGLVLDLKVFYFDPVPIILSCMWSALEQCSVYKVFCEVEMNPSGRYRWQRWQIKTSAAAEQASPHMLERLGGGELTTKHLDMIQGALAALPQLNTVIVDGLKDGCGGQLAMAPHLAACHGLRQLSLVFLHLGLLTDMAFAGVSMDQVHTIEMYGPENDLERYDATVRIWQALSQDDYRPWRQVVPSLKRVLWHTDLQPPPSDLLPPGVELQVINLTSAGA